MELMIFAGPNGSGKSTAIAAFKKGLELGGFEYINPDIYARAYFSDMPDELERYKKAFEFAEYKRGTAYENGDNFIIETVNSTTGKFEFYRKCKDKGYKITVVYVCTESPDINLRRVARRAAQGGHDVPPEKTVARYRRSLDNLLGLSLFADVLYLFDNSNDGKPPALCYYKDEKESKLSEKIPAWVQTHFIDKLPKD